MARFNYIIPGILTPLEDARTWDYQAQGWLWKNSFGISAGFNYAAGVVGGILSRQEFGHTVRSDLTHAMQAFETIVCVGHSNGCGILLDALCPVDPPPTPFITELHLIAAAVDNDCEKNGLNQPARRGQVGSVFLYVSSADEILGLPVVSYGDLGKVGPSNVCPELAKILTIVDPPAADCGHCDWVTKYFDWTMQRIATAGGTSTTENTETNGGSA